VRSLDEAGALEALEAFEEGAANALEIVRELRASRHTRGLVRRERVGLIKRKLM
jgi:hypothetical protein